MEFKTNETQPSSNSTKQLSESLLLILLSLLTHYHHHYYHLYHKIPSELKHVHQLTWSRFCRLWWPSRWWFIFIITAMTKGVYNWGKATTNFNNETYSTVENLCKNKEKDKLCGSNIFLWQTTQLVKSGIKEETDQLRSTKTIK